MKNLFEKKEIQFDVISEEQKSTEKYYTKKNEKTTEKFEIMGEEFFHEYTKTAAINYLRLAIETNKGFPIDRIFIESSFGYPTGDNKTKRRIMKEILEELGAPNKMQDTFNRREEQHLVIVEKLLQKINPDIKLDRDYIQTREIAVGPQGQTTPKIESNPDLRLQLHSHGLDGVLELKTTTKQFQERADVVMLPQLIQYCGHHPFIWIVSLTNREFTEVLDNSGSNSEISAGLGIQGREFDGKKLIKEIKTFLAKKQKIFNKPIPRKRGDLPFSAMHIGIYMLKLKSEKDFIKKYREYLIEQEIKKGKGIMKNSKRKVGTNLKEYEEELKDKKILYLHGPEIFELLKQADSDKSDLIYKQLAEQYNIILAINDNIDEFKKMLESYKLDNESKELETLI